MLYVVVPAFNEHKRIGRVIRDLFEHGITNVVVVDDGSTDDTAAVAHVAGAHVVRHCVNRGQGAALETGNRYALAQGALWIAHFDGDGQFRVEDIMQAVQIANQKQVDIIFGSRYLTDTSAIPWLKRTVLLPMGRCIHNIFTGMPLTDFHNGFRLLSSHAAQQIHITQDGMAHNSEIVAAVKRFNLSWIEAPTVVTYHEFGQGIGGGIKIVGDLLLDSLLKK